MIKHTVPQAVFDSPSAFKAAREGHAQACRELERTPRHRLDKSNPNHPDYDLKLFGYDAKEFIAKQYKKPALAKR